ncbi:MAG TPA: 2-C-methyl-D-erythritol 4-phosphate cytidylyltransferase [Acidobacteriota bacterium]|jgi:2-C-methyl-D-erythritol 4-phosphate cytidylyltransferase
MKCSAVVVAAGSGSRIKSEIPKQLLHLGGIPLFLWSLHVFQKMEKVNEILLVVPRDKAGNFRELLPDGSEVKWVTGGPRRQDSVKAGLERVSLDAQIVLIHDAARPFFSPQLVDRLIDSAAEQGASIPVAPVSETLKEVSQGRVIRTLSREQIYRAQTPQAFRREILIEIFQSVPQDRTWTDEASMLEFAGVPVAAVQGDQRNIKITLAEDFHYAEYLLSQMKLEAPDHK